MTEDRFWKANRNAKAAEGNDTMIRRVLAVLLGRDNRLLGAAASGDIQSVRRLLDQGADVNARDELGQTPLHHAACSGHKDVAELLIRRGAVVTARDSVGRTPLYISAVHGHLQLNQLLISNCV